VKHLTRAFAAGALVSAIVLAGCTAKSAEPDAPAVPEVSQAEGGLQAKLLSESDLPEGYSETQLPTVQGGFGSLIGCPALEPPAPSDADEARVSFAGTPPGNLISETVRLAGPEVTHQVLADLAKVTQTCKGLTAATAPQLGKESTAVELNATLNSVGTVVNGYIIGLRNDQIMVVIVYVSPGKADLATVETVTRKAWEKASPAAMPSPTIGS
jgi:hypothetical protein